MIGLHKFFNHKQPSYSIRFSFPFPLSFDFPFPFQTVMLNEISTSSSSIFNFAKLLNICDKSWTGAITWLSPQLPLDWLSISAAFVGNIHNLQYNTWIIGLCFLYSSPPPLASQFPKHNLGIVVYLDIQAIDVHSVYSCDKYPCLSCHLSTQL